MLYGKFVDERDNPVNNPKIYNGEGNNSFFFLIRFRNCIFYTGNYYVVFCKQSIQIINILE